MKQNLEAWLVSEKEFPKEGSLQEKLAFCIRYAVLAPSTYNTQPWYFHVGKDHVDLFADRRYALAVIDPDDRQLTLSCGAALYNLRLALNYFGFSEEVHILPETENQDLLVRVQVRENENAGSEPATQSLFKAIPRRAFNRSPFKDKVPPPEDLESLKRAAESEHAWLHVCSEEEKEVVSLMIADGDQIQMSQKSFRREFAAWSDSRRYQNGDGYPEYSVPYTTIMKARKPFILRRFEKAPGVVVEDEDIAECSPVLAVLGAEKGGTFHRLQAGQAFMKMLLQAEALGLSITMLSQPCEVPELRLRLHDEIDQYRARAHFIFRIGYANPVDSKSPRRPMEEVLEYKSGAKAKMPTSGKTGMGKGGFFGWMKKLFVAK